MSCKLSNKVKESCLKNGGVAITKPQGILASQFVFFGTDGKRHELSVRSIAPYDKNPNFEIITIQRHPMPMADALENIRHALKDVVKPEHIKLSQSNNYITIFAKRDVISSFQKEVEKELPSRDEDDSYKMRFSTMSFDAFLEWAQQNEKSSKWITDMILIHFPEEQ